MPNTVYGPFSPITVIQGSTPANATWGNLVQTQASIALNGVNGDLATPFVLSGVACTKDGSIANQLDVASGRAYLKMSDGTLGLIIVGTTTFTTATPSSTYYLFLLNGGTFQWSTTSSGPANSLAICQATTDGSGNILVVTDKRTLVTRLLPGAGTNGMLAVPLLTQMGPIDTTTGNQAFISTAQDAHSGKGWSFYLMQDGSLLFNEWTSGNNPLRLSPTGGLQVIGGQASAGAFGAPVIVAQAINVPVTVTTTATIVSYTVPVTGAYRVSVYFTLNNGTSGQKISLDVSSQDPNTGASLGEFLVAVAGNLTILSGAVAIANSGYYCMPAMVYAKAGTILAVFYQDPLNTPADFVTAIVERMA